MKSFKSANDNNPDCWYGVQDPRKRKQIQDRLAQRARRKRLAATSKNSQRPLQVRRETDESSQGYAATGGNVDSDHSDTTMVVAKRQFPVSPPFSSPTIGMDSPRLLFLSSVPCLHPHLPDGPRILPSPKTSAIMALFVNGSVMGMHCGNIKVIKSSPQPSSVPESLQPTPLQLATPHYDWIDRWPFPRMRDNMILLNAVIDAEEMFVDFFKMESFSIKQGGLAWDPNAWQISPEWETKWGYLFY